MSAVIAVIADIARDRRHRKTKPTAEARRHGEEPRRKMELLRDRKVKGLTTD
jgi:hypothetical protein